MTLSLSIIFGTVGVTLGSFYNVVGRRVPINSPFIIGRSKCLHCEHELSWYELIPIISFGIQKGKCRHCFQKINITYPVFEFLMGCIFIISYLSFGLTKEFILVLIFSSFLMICTISEMTYFVIPIKFPLFFITLFILTMYHASLTVWLDSIVGAILGVILIIIYIDFIDEHFHKNYILFWCAIGFMLGIHSMLVTVILILAFYLISQKAAILTSPYTKGLTLLIFMLF